MAIEVAGSSEMCPRQETVDGTLLYEGQLILGPEHVANLGLEAVMALSTDPRLNSQGMETHFFRGISSRKGDAGRGDKHLSDLSDLYAGVSKPNLAGGIQDMTRLNILGGEAQIEAVRGMLKLFGTNHCYLGREDQTIYRYPAALLAAQLEQNKQPVPDDLALLYTVAFEVTTKSGQLDYAYGMTAATGPDHHNLVARTDLFLEDCKEACFGDTDNDGRVPILVERRRLVKGVVHSDLAYTEITRLFEPTSRFTPATTILTSMGIRHQFERFYGHRSDLAPSQRWSWCNGGHISPGTFLPKDLIDPDPRNELGRDLQVITLNGRSPERDGHFGPFTFGLAIVDMTRPTDPDKPFQPKVVHVSEAPLYKDPTAGAVTFHTQYYPTTDRFVAHVNDSEIRAYDLPPALLQNHLPSLKDLAKVISRYTN